MSTSIPPAFSPTSEDRNWAMVAHLASLIAMWVFLGVVGPLFVWLIKKDQSSFVEDQAKEALNFQLFMLVLGVIYIIITLMTCGIGGLLMLPLYGVICILNIVFCIIGAVTASGGQLYRYPLNWRLIK